MAPRKGARHVFMALLIAFLICFCPPLQAGPDIGQRGVLRWGKEKRLPVGINETAWNNYIIAVSVDDKKLIKSIVRSGKVFGVPAGTMVQVVDFHKTWFQVRILNGPFKDFRVWTFVKMVNAN
jgi:hypothetical protein